MHAESEVNNLYVLCRQIFEGKWVKRIYSPETPAELGFGSSKLRSGSYGLRPYYGSYLNRYRDLVAGIGSLCRDDLDAEDNLAQILIKFEDQVLDRTAGPTGTDPRFLPGSEPDLLQRYKAASEKWPIPPAEHLRGTQIIHKGKPKWVKQYQESDDNGVSYIVPIYHTMQGLKTSARGGCRLCAMLCDKVWNKRAEEPENVEVKFKRAIGVIQCGAEDDGTSQCNKVYTFSER